MAHRSSVAPLSCVLMMTLLGIGDAYAAPFKVMPLGNSITECHDKPGVQPASYRCRLWHMVDSAGYEIDFVGSRWGVMDEYTPWPEPSSQTAATCPYAGFDQDHEGHVAWRADEILRGSTNTTYGYPDSLARWVDAADPDIVLVHIGTNDCWQSQSATGTADDIREIIDTLQAGNPRVIVLLAQILPMADAGKNACVDALNALLPSVAAEKTTALSPIIVVDHNSGFDIGSDSDDGVHPNESGEWKMAAVWFDALVPILSIPVADAGADQSVSRGDDVTLDGSGSFDPNGDALRYRWRQVEGLRVTLSDSTVTQPSFSTSAMQSADSLVFELAVSDSFTTTRDTVAVIVTGRPPAVRMLSPLDSASLICSQPTALSANAHDTDGTIVQVAFYSGDDLIGEATARGDSVWDMAWSSVPCGVHLLTARATDDDGYADTSDAVLLYAGNPPELTPLADTGVAESDSLCLAISATDADGDPIALAMTDTLPGATFVDHGDGTGSLGWRPDFEQAGSYAVRFTASDSLFADTLTVTIEVSDVNRPPALACTTALTIDEAAALTVTVTGADPDSDSVALSCDNLPAGAVFTDSGNGRGALAWTPGYDQAGEYRLVFVASDGALSDSDTVVVTVTDVNRPPELLTPADQSVNEGDTLRFSITATDPDDHAITVTAEQLPAGALFVDSGDGRAGIEWVPGYEQAGEHRLVIVASDGALSDSDTVVVTVTDVNRPPELLTPADQSVNEGDTLRFSITATDPDDHAVTVTAEQLPAGALFVDSGDGRAGIEWVPGYDQAGEYRLVFVASDGALSDSDTVVVTVSDVNRPPELLTPADQSINEGDTLRLIAAAVDPDGDSVALSIAPLPPEAVWDDSGNGTALLTWAPGYSDSGTYELVVRASDGALSDSLTLSIAVVHVNRSPTFAAPDSVAGHEGDSITFAVVAHDPDSDDVELRTGALPEGASVLDTPARGRTFVWEPGFAQAGEYLVTFVAGDMDTTVICSVAVTVHNTNRTPSIVSTPDTLTAAGMLYRYECLADDPDSGETLVFSLSSAPAGMAIDSAAGLASWTPDSTDTGRHQVEVCVRDPWNARDTQTFELRVEPAVVVRQASPHSTSAREPSERHRAPVLAVPNPTVPTTRRVPAGDFSVTHAPHGLAWVRNDQAGVVFRVTLTDMRPGTELECAVSIRDLAGNLVTTRRTRGIVLSEDRILDIYWNCTSDHGAPVEAGVYRVAIVVAGDGGTGGSVGLKGFVSLGIRSR